MTIQVTIQDPRSATLDDLLDLVPGSVAAEEIEEIMLALQGAANFLRGMTFDPRLPNDIPSACLHKATELDQVLEKHLETT